MNYGDCFSMVTNLVADISSVEAGPVFLGSLNSALLPPGLCACVHIHVCSRGHACVCVSVCVSLCVCVHLCVYVVSPSILKYKQMGNFFFLVLIANNLSLSYRFMSLDGGVFIDISSDQVYSKAGSFTSRCLSSQRGGCDPM
jgi:hypothetical protein